MATNGRKRYFHIDENASIEQIYALLDDVESSDEDDIDNLMNYDTEFIAEEEITQAASTWDTSLTTPEANLDVVPSDNQPKKKEKNKKEELWKWTKKVKVTKQEECHLVPEIQPNLNETVSPIEIFSLVTGLEELLELIVEQSNLYAHQNGRNFTVTKEELKTFLGINFLMAINKQPTIAEYWIVDNQIGNVGIQNTMIRNRFREILQSLHFVDNRKDNKTDKAFTMGPVIDHINSEFFEVLSKDSEQSIDEHMVKFKGRSRMKQYMKSKPIKWGFKFWFCCSSKSGYLYQMDIYLGRKQTPEFNLGLGEEVVLQLMKDLERSFCTVYFDNFFDSPKLIEKLF